MIDQNLPIRQSPVPEERRRQIAQLIREAGSVTVAGLEQRFGVSPMTVRRDLEVLEREGYARRTHGGAVLPGFSRNEDSFWERLEKEVGGKERLAHAALGLLQPGEAVFIDSSTTAYYLARLIVAQSLRITLLTTSLPVMELFTASESPNVELVGIGGSLRKLTLSFVGPQAVQSIAAHFADKVFLSIKGLTPDGYLTDPDPLEAEVKRTMIEHAEKPVLLVDGSKFEQRGLSVIAHMSRLSLALVAEVPSERVAALSRAGLEVRHV